LLWDNVITPTLNTPTVITPTTFSPTPMLFYDHKPLADTKEYNFLGTVIDHKGCFKRGIQELSKKGLKGLLGRQQSLN
jgi:hypothetical protein